MLSFKRVIIPLTLMLAIFSSFLILKKQKPSFYIIGDSTVKNGDGTGKNNQMGWGTMIDVYFFYKSDHFHLTSRTLILYIITKLTLIHVYFM